MVVDYGYVADQSVSRNLSGTLRYSIQSYPESNGQSVAVVDDAPFWKHVVISEGGLSDESFLKPYIVNIGARVVLIIPHSEGGSSGASSDFVYEKRGNSWSFINTPDWARELARQLPENKFASSAVSIDYAGLFAVAGVLNEGDAMCCPTGGQLNIRLHFGSDSIVIDSVHLDAETPTSSGNQ